MALLAAAMAIPSWASHAQAEPYRPYPFFDLAFSESGQQAIAALGDQFATVAEWYGWTPDVLKREFKRTASVEGKAWKIDTYGRIYIDENFAASQAPVRSVDTSFAPRYPLHSRPNATRKIVLSFGGTTLSGSAWDDKWQSSRTLLPFDTDGNLRVLSDSEANRIARIWTSVADDFAPFDVDVTTEDIGDPALLRSGPDDTTYGIRVVIYSGLRQNSSDSGVYLNSFGDPTRPILLNANALGGGDPDYVADAVSHLVGHSLGLREDFENRRDNARVSRFVPSDGEVLAGRRVAPIMGNPFGAQVSRFTAGNYPNAANGEPDVAIMVNNGLPLLADDAGDTAMKASYLEDIPGQTGHYINGLIERPGDQDVYAIHAGAGVISAYVMPYPTNDNRTEGANLSLELSLWHAGSKVKSATAAPDAEEQRVSLNYNSSVPGTYFLAVRPVKERSGPTAGVEYGNRGRYSGAIFADPAGRTLPVVSLAPGNGVKGQSITLRASSPTAAIARYRWDFGDGSRVISTTVPQVTKTYEKPGTYTATVEIVDRQNFTASATATVIVTDQTATVGNPGQTPTPGNTGQTPPTTGNTGQTPPTTGNTGQTPPTTGNTGQTPPTTGNPNGQNTAACVSGTWSVVSFSQDEMKVQYETEHFAFRWKDGVMRKSDAAAVGSFLERAWATLVDKDGFPEPYCDSATKHKVNVNLDPTFELTGGPVNVRDMGMWIGTAHVQNYWGLAHEFGHALQGSTWGLHDSVYTGWFWESHANWLAHQMIPERTGCWDEKDDPALGNLVNFPHIYYGSTRSRYCNWQFLEFIKDKYGYAAVNGIWANALKPTEAGYTEEDPFTALMRTQNWSLTQLNDEFGDWARHNVTWDYVDKQGKDQGPVYRASYGSYDDTSWNRANRVTRLEEMDPVQRRYAVPNAWAPQRWGYNLVRLMPDAGASTVTVTFRGVVQTAPATTALAGLANDPTSIPQPGSDWRWSLVAVQADGTPRYGALMRGADGEQSFDVKPDDKALYMVVVGTPSIHNKIRWDQPYYSIYRYPWMVQLTGARPQGFEPGYTPGSNGHIHPNGGGWVSNSATVAPTAFVGRYARVLGGTVTGNARIEDNALVFGGTISDNAVVGAMAMIGDGVTISGNAKVLPIYAGFRMRGTSFSGNAVVYGDAALWNAVRLAKGAYSGPIAQSSESDPSQGSERTAPPPEVTSTAPYVWRQ